MRLKYMNLDKRIKNLPQTIWAAINKIDTLN